MTQNTANDFDIRESVACFNCGTTEGRIEHGGYYCGQPVCDECARYADANHGRRRPVTTFLATELIAAARDLDDLYFILLDIDANCSEAADIDYSSLPTFGGEDIEPTTGLYSWDETRTLWSMEDGHWHLVDRA